MHCGSRQPAIGRSSSSDVAPRWMASAMNSRPCRAVPGSAANIAPGPISDEEQSTSRTRKSAQPTKLAVGNRCLMLTVISGRILTRVRGGWNGGTVRDSAHCVDLVKMGPPQQSAIRDQVRFMGCSLWTPFGFRQPITSAGVTRSAGQCTLIWAENGERRILAHRFAVNEWDAA